MDQHSQGSKDAGDSTTKLTVPVYVLLEKNRFVCTISHDCMFQFITTWFSDITFNPPHHLMIMPE